MKTWDEAKERCLNLGDGWDLPSSYTSLVAARIVNRTTDIIKGTYKENLPKYEEFVRNDYSLWASINDSVDNKYFKGTSNIVFYHDSLSSEPEIRNISSEEIKKNMATLTIFENNIGKIEFRTKKEMDFVRAEMKEINRIEKENGGYGTHHYNLGYPHPDVFSDKSNLILSKPMKDEYEENLNSLKFVIKYLKDGHTVYCEKDLR